MTAGSISSSCESSEILQQKHFLKKSRNKLLSSKLLVNFHRQFVAGLVLGLEFVRGFVQVWDQAFSPMDSFLHLNPFYNFNSSPIFEAILKFLLSLG